VRDFPIRIKLKFTGFQPFLHLGICLPQIVIFTRFAQQFINIPTDISQIKKRLCAFQQRMIVFFYRNTAAFRHLLHHLFIFLPKQTFFCSYSCMLHTYTRSFHFAQGTKRNENDFLTAYNAGHGS
jgi:hypothetical protein